MIESNLLIADRHRDFAKTILIIEIVVVVNLLADLVCGVKQTDDFISLGGSVDFLHNPRTC